MGVNIGNASIDENGSAHGGKAGDQTGREVKINAWKSSSKKWYVFRPIDPAVAEKIAYAMEAACKNDLIGYDQYQRTTLRSLVENASPAYFPGEAKKACETDCSELVRTCIAYAVGHDICKQFIESGSSFNTGNEPTILTKTGLFKMITDEKQTENPEYLKRGDIIVTRTKGHTAVVLDDGKYAPKTITKYPQLHMGSKGSDVKRLQNALMTMGFALPKYGADGDFGSETLAAVAKFQNGHVPGCTIGLVDDATWEEIEKFTVDCKNVISKLALIVRPLHKYDKGVDVKYMQLGLMAAGYSLPKYGADGDFGSETRIAVMTFQNENELTIDGGFDEEDLNKLIKILK